MARSGLIQIISTIVTLALAFGIDKWLVLQHRIAYSNSNFPLFFTWMLISCLFLLVIWIAIAWILFRTWQSLPISILVLILGFTAFILPFAYLLIPGMPYLFEPPFSAFTVTGMFVSVLSLLHLHFSNYIRINTSKTGFPS